MTLGGVEATFFGWSPEAWIAIGTLVLAAVTVIAIFVQEPLRDLYGRARLEMEIQHAPPDTTMIAMRDRKTGSILGMGLYVRARVTHKRGKAAENVELLAASLRRLDPATNEWQVSSNFLPLTLLWSHVLTSTMRVPRQLFRLCDLGHFVHDATHGTALWLDTIVQPNPVGTGTLPNVLHPGTYEIELLLSGDNVKTISGRWRIKFGPAWSNDEATMLRRVRITPARASMTTTPSCDPALIWPNPFNP